MLEAVLQELLLAIGRFFINPLLYVALLTAIVLGYVRVKRERKNFHIRIHNGWTELKSVLGIGFIWTLLLSLLTIVAGLTVPLQFLLVLTVVSIIMIIVFNFHLLSAVITWSVTYLTLIIIEWQQIEFNLLGLTISGLKWNDESAITVTIIIGLLLIAEGILIHKQGSINASPILEKTKRGLKSVSFFSKKLSIIPVLFIIPADVIDSFAPWWPLFTIGSEQFGFILFPVVIGFQQITRRLLPLEFYPKLGRNVRILGEITVLGGALAYFDTRIACIVMIVAVIMRLVISVGYKLTERKDVYAVAPTNKGVMIAAVLPGSPAEKMGLITGEIITRVNGRTVQTERELYEALQINAAHCKLEVLNHQKEIRLTQYVVHSEDHYQIGLIIV